jgi:hypothetical protein
MPQNSNSASRLHSLFSQISNHSGQSQVLTTWVNTFAISETVTKRQAVVVAKRLETIFRELELTREGMNKAQYSTGLYESALDALQEAASPMLLPNTWAHVLQYLTPQNLLAIQFCGEILPNEESQIPEKELAELSLLVSELRTAADSQTLPASLRVLLLHHADLIENALAAYPITGMKALREAAQTGLGELVESKDIVAEHSNLEEVSKLAKVWKRVGEVADGAAKVDKLIQFGQKAWSLIESIWPDKS